MGLRALWTQRAVKDFGLNIYKLGTCENAADLGTAVEHWWLCKIGPPEEDFRDMEEAQVNGIEADVLKKCKGNKGKFLTALWLLCGALMAACGESAETEFVAIDDGNALRGFAIGSDGIVICPYRGNVVKLVLTTVSITVGLCKMLRTMRRDREQPHEEREEGDQTQIRKLTRTVAVQSQCTYKMNAAQPRFQPLAETAAGAWASC